MSRLDSLRLELERAERDLSVARNVAAALQLLANSDTAASVVVGHTRHMIDGTASFMLLPVHAYEGDLVKALVHVPHVCVAHGGICASATLLLKLVRGEAVGHDYAATAASFAKIAADLPEGIARIEQQIEAEEKRVDKGPLTVGELISKLEALNHNLPVLLRTYGDVSCLREIEVGDGSADMGYRGAQVCYLKTE